MVPRTPLLRPDRYFAEWTFDPERLVVLGAFSTLAVPVGYWVVILLVTLQVGGTVVVDNPRRPPGRFCDDPAGNAETPTGVFGEACSEPEQVERNIDTFLWDTFGGAVPATLVSIPTVMMLVGVLFRAGSSTLGGGVRWLESFAVALWGLVPLILGIGLYAIAVWLAFEPITVAPTADPSLAVDHARRELRAVGWITPLVSAAGLGWSSLIWRFGLIERADLGSEEATALALTPALVVLAIALV